MARKHMSIGRSALRSLADAWREHGVGDHISGALQEALRGALREELPSIEQDAGQRAPQDGAAAISNGNRSSTMRAVLREALVQALIAGAREAARGVLRAALQAKR